MAPCMGLWEQQRTIVTYVQPEPTVRGRVVSNADPVRTQNNQVRTNARYAPLAPLTGVWDHTSHTIVSLVYQARIAP